MRRILLFMMSLLGLVPPATAGEPLRMLYFDRPPYYIAGPGGPHGLLVDRTRAILAAADVRAVWIEASPRRIIEVVSQDLEPICSPGWFVTDERAGIGRFTAPLYRDPPQLLLLPKDSAIPARYADLAAILADPVVRVLVKSSFSYGAQIDDLLKTARARLHETNAKTAQMARMVAGGRADFLFISADEGQGQMASDPALRDLQLFAAKGLTRGETRHILCSHRVDPEVVARMSKAAEDLYKIAP